jgi:hypothetical protein
MLERRQQDMRSRLRASGAFAETLATPQSVVPPVRYAVSLASIAICLLGLVCVRPSFGEQLESNPESAQVVRGTVVNRLTHEPVGRALVYSADNRFATLTDSEGHFEFRIQKPEAPPAGNSNGSMFQRLRFKSGGPYVLRARKPGFLEDPGGSSDVPVSPGAENKIFLLPEGIIQGRVSVSGTEPSNRITLQLFKREIQNGRSHWHGRFTAHTNSSGEFRFAELGPGEYKLMTLEQLDNDPEMVAPSGPNYGFPPSCFPGVPDFQSGTTIQLASGQTLDASITLTRKPYFPVRLPVVGVEAESGINVSVLAQGHPGPGYSLGYNSSQHRIEGLLPNGTYLIEARAFGPKQASGVATITVAGRALEGPMLAMSSISPIPVHVKEEFTSDNQKPGFLYSGRAGNGGLSFRLTGPRAYLQLYLEPVNDFASSGGGGLRPPTSPDDQTLAITNPFPGLYWVHVESSRGYPASVAAGDTDLRVDPLVVSSGGNLPIEITMRDDGATLEGTVTRGSQDTAATPGSSIQSVGGPRAWIYCLPLSGSTGRFQEFAPSPDGKFRSPVMAPGAYRVLAFEGPRPELAYRDSEAMRAYSTRGQVVNLTAGQSMHLELELIPTVE